MTEDISSKITFIVGHYKSGSTWLSHLLSLYPGIRGIRETHVFRYVKSHESLNSVTQELFTESAWGAGGVKQFPRFWLSNITRDLRSKFGLATGTASLPTSDVPTSMLDLGLVDQYFLRKKLRKSSNGDEYCRHFFTHLIKRFLVPDSTDPDPLTRTGPTELPPVVRRRQQLLKEQGFLGIIVRMTSAQSESERGQGRGVSYDRLAALEPNVFKVCRLCNALAKHIVNSNIENCIHMKDIGAIDVYRCQIGFNLSATAVLQVLHKDNMRLLRLLEPSSFQTWIEVMNTSIDEEKIDGRLDLAVEFLSVTCVCAADRSAYFLHTFSS